MLTARYLECLAADKARLREVAEGHLDASVPSCPGWTVHDLVQHVSEVYLHKVACMQLGRQPDELPPDPGSEPALHRLDRAFDELCAEFAKRASTDPAYTWYPPDQSVGFWIRRMAQETTIHRVDGELAVGKPTAVPADLAADGIDEVLTIFLGWGTTAYCDLPSVAGLLAEADGRSVAIRSGKLSYLLCPAAGGVQVSQGADGAAAVVSGEPSPLLLWLWNRADRDAVRIEGDIELVGYLRRLMADATE
jgi:uncharacterized protein (TIGR03083 family)